MSKGKRERRRRASDPKVTVTYPGAQGDVVAASIDSFPADDTVTVIWPDPEPPHSPAKAEVPVREFLARMDGTDAAHQFRQASQPVGVIALMEVGSLHQWLRTQPSSL